MAHIDELSQDEIDALLNAMTVDKPKSSDSSGVSTPLLSQEEIDTLLNAASSIQTSLASGKTATPLNPKLISSRKRDVDVEKYDFTMPSLVSREHIKSLNTLHNTYARSLSSSLSMLLRTLVEVECLNIEQLNYGEYLASILEPSCIAVFSMRPLKGLGVIEINLPLVFPIIDRLLGGQGNTRAYNRALTVIEEMVVTKLIQHSLVILQESWQRTIKLEMKLERLENNPQFIQIAATGDPIILILFDIRMGSIRGMMSLCFPFMTIQQARANLRHEEFPTLVDEQNKNAYRKMMLTHFYNIQITVCARYEPSHVSLGEILGLQKGDIIKLSNADRNEVLISVGGQPKFYGRPGMVDGKRAVQIYRKEKR